MSGICDTCKRECHAHTDGLKACDCHMGGESRYSKLFGTPERAARTIAEYGKTIYACAECPLCHDPIGATCEINGECPWVDEESGYDALLEWLMGDSE